MKYAPFIVAIILFGCPQVRADVSLWFSKDDLPGLRKTIAQGKEAETWQHILERADEYCTPGSPRYADPAAVGEHPTSSPRVQVLGHYFGRRLTQWMECLGFAYQMTGDEKYARHGILLLEAAVEKLPVTNPDIAKGFAGARGDIMRGLAVGYDWLGEAMTPEQEAAWAEASAAYVRNIIAEVSRERAWWRPYHNFMGVALGAAGLLSLKLQEFYPDEAPGWTAFLAERIKLWLDNGFDARGAYVEGTTYGVYGLSNSLRFADALHRAGGPNLLEHRHLQGVPHFFTTALLPGEAIFDARNDANYDRFRDATLLLLAREHVNGLAKWLWERAGDNHSPFVII